MTRAAFNAAQISLRKQVLCWLPAAALMMCSLAQAQTWPAGKPVRLVVPVSPGGSTDIIARTVAQALSQNLGQSFVVDSKPGAAGAIASVEVARSPADGYTLLVATSSTHSVAPALSSQLKYNPVDDFTPIAMLAEANNFILLSPSIEAKSIKELVALARQKPGVLNYSSSGIGSFGHLTFEFFASQAGISLTHVPFTGTAS